MIFCYLLLLGSCGFNIIINSLGKRSGGMLYVSTNNAHEQALLEQEFSRDGNLFAVPLKKTSQIEQLIQSITFELYKQNHDPCYNDHISSHPLHELSSKITTLIHSTLKLTIPLGQIRSIFQVLRTQETKLKLYQQYILQMNKHFMAQMQQEDEEWGHGGAGTAELMELDSEFWEQVVGAGATRGVLDMDFQGQDGRADDFDGMCVGEAEEGNGGSKKRRSIVSIQECKYKYDSPTDEDAQTMHTLKSQITNSPKFSLTPLSQLQAKMHSETKALRQQLGQGMEDRRGTNYKIDRLNCSFHYADGDGDGDGKEGDQLVEVKDEMRMDCNSMQVFYCPEWKRNEDEQKKATQGLTASEPKKLGSNDSNYIENLSGRVHPVPSFLHDDSLGQMIVKQKREDVRKSQILKKSMHGIDENKQASNDHTYTSNLRLIKFHNKLRKNSKKSIGTKKDLDQLRSVHQDSQQMQPFVKQKNSNYMSDEKLVRKRESDYVKSNTNVNVNVNSKIEELIGSKIGLKKQPQRKISMGAKPNNKAFNFFKAKRQ